MSACSPMTKRKNEPIRQFLDQSDIFPALVNRVAPQLAKPLADIFNVITTTGEWPEVWKIEYMTPIPKTSMPSGPDDLRNIFLVPNYSVKYMRVLSWND